MALAACVLLTPVSAREKASSPQLQMIIEAVVANAKRGEGKLIADGIVLRKVRQHGDIVMFDMTVVDPVMLAYARGQQANFQQIAIKDMGRKFCRRGTGTRKFVDMGGEIQVVFYGARREMLAGGRLTRC
ncbi:hypothetical protein [Marimonas lutisalis]|uniref:hypothetical protein n=1 Tax=Marimonas lutisalis TaxID=2545756 RepID=UPI0010F88DC1|nr:hypothetical protein [Marimonas lutisalis]